LAASKRIMKITLTVVIILLFSSCKPKPELIRHKDLLGFKAIYVAEPEDDTYRKNKIESKMYKLQIKYVEEVIYVSTYSKANGCGKHFGNIQTRNDTIVLTYDFVDETACASLRIDKLTYLIDNPRKRKRKIKFE
jgi:hypothetical protein